MNSPQKLILRTQLPAGDVVMLTAAVRDLHHFYPGKYVTDVRTEHPALWMNNPYLTPLDEEDPAVTVIDCHYPAINRNRTSPVHYLEGYIEFLNDYLGINMHPSAFRGDIHLSPEEINTPSVVEETLGANVPFWIIVAGGKYDFTVKWWDHRRYQEVVDQLEGRVVFAQVGTAGFFHPPLRGVLDLRAKTTMRELVQLVYRSSGILCPITLLSHMAAAVPARPGTTNRPCVVVAGGREPVSWPSYPNHQFVHTIGALSCCAETGCWRSRTVPLNDGTKLDDERELCLDVVDGTLPRCMDLIQSADIVRRIEWYIDGSTPNGGYLEQSRGISQKLSDGAADLQHAVRSLSTLT